MRGKAAADLNQLFVAVSLPPTIFSQVPFGTPTQALASASFLAVPAHDDVAV